MTEHVVNLSRLAAVRDGTGHSIYGASGSSMFLNCVGSLIPNLLVKDSGNVDASYGSIAHGVTEEWLDTGVRPDHLVGVTRSKDGFDIEIDDVMIDFARECVDRCEWEPGDHLIEEHVDYSDLTPIPNQGGTLDFAALRHGEALIVDHKFGKAEQVFAKRNTQLMLYAYGLYRRYNWLYEFKRFIIRINQPRIDHFDEWVCSVEELLEFAAYAKQRMHAAWRIDAPRTAGEKQCRYCRIKTSCTANALHQAELLEGTGDFGDESATAEDMQAFKNRLDDDIQMFELLPLSAGNLSTAHIAKLHRQSKTALYFWKNLAAELFKRAQLGEDLSEHDLKLVEGKTNRTFLNQPEVEKLLTSKGVHLKDVYETSIVSPAKAEELLKKAGVRRKDIPDLLSGFTSKPPGKPTLAPLADRRPALVDISNVAFGDESTETTDEEEL